MAIGPNLNSRFSEVHRNNEIEEKGVVQNGWKFKQSNCDKFRR